jgi:hypothetical protein
MKRTLLSIGAALALAMAALLMGGRDAAAFSVGGAPAGSANVPSAGMYGGSAARGQPSRRGFDGRETCWRLRLIHGAWRQVWVCN